MGGKIAIIGAGAAGLTAAGAAAKSARKVFVIERNDIIGKKLLITGKGRCNITNAADISDFPKQYPTNGRFLYSALNSLNNEDIINIIEENGTKTKIERGGRVFPVSDRSRDVVAALKKYAFADNVELIHGRVSSIVIKNGEVKGVKIGDRTLSADKVIVCTGGKSYPKTGSTGDGYRFAEAAGHTVIEPKPSLVPLVAEEDWVRSLMGLSLKNVAISAFNQKNKRVYEDFGEMLFTHFGISGPVVLSMSAHLKNIGKEKYRIVIDLKPALSREQLDKRLLRDFEKYKKKHIINALDDLLPKNLIPQIIELSGIEPHRQVCEITKKERQELCRILKQLELTAVGFRPIEEAIVTSGGVKTSEIDSSTMESKKVRGLYFAGEVIDVDGYTGGFNLQAAFSTGYLAGKSAAEMEE
ncbi:MAG: NAD(P)/FAD-dependent oxidoreductase [Clostridiales bacterium]|nr:NAD(P)/FAD-dependent oxidoreductase [Clostridiales bacterium]